MHKQKMENFFFIPKGRNCNFREEIWWWAIFNIKVEGCFVKNSKNEEF